MREILVEMTVAAWYPHFHFRLSFGAQDQMKSILDDLFTGCPVSPGGHARQTDQLRKFIVSHGDLLRLEHLVRYVPFRLLRPFFEIQLRGERDHKVNDRIAVLADDTFHSSRPPLYRFIQSAEPGIELHPSWSQYLLDSLPVVQGWLDHHWILYLQARNPNTPAIPNKIIAPARRASLQSQKAYWTHIVNAQPVRCIYSGKRLEKGGFALDHFIPWTFVSHDQLWNLVPVLPEANASKGNRLPCVSYLDALIETQSMGLQLSRDQLRLERWSKVTEPFVSDLRIDPADLLDTRKVKEAYEAVFPSMISLAARAGFSVDWRYSS